MLSIKNLSKEYKTKTCKYKVLDNINISFKDNGLVAILGPSGAGKTTLLNIIGGLDKYESGDIIIDKISTKNYKDKDYDNYRSNTVGFIFQNYNLIEHQTVLKNVELALTLSKINYKNKKKLSIDILKKVGLEDQINKKPNELSGGQKQRVAIARALVKKPKIILADEPTGALDSKTSIEIMELLKKISKDTLVIMVTHNINLANKYSNRIITIKDGKITNDNNPFNKSTTKNHKKNSKKNIKLITAFNLSLNSLLKKKGRTMLTSLAASLGIIGIALILSISQSIKKQIEIEKRNYLDKTPIKIETKVLRDIYNIDNKKSNKCNKNYLCINNDKNELEQSNIHINDINKLKTLIDTNYMNINKYIKKVNYINDIDINIYSFDNKINLQNTKYNFLDFININNINKDYIKVNGKYPNNINEAILVINKDKKINYSLLYKLNLIEDKNTKVNDIKIKYKDIYNKNYTIVYNTDIYNNIDKTKILNNGINLKIVGIFIPKNDDIINNKLLVSKDIKDKLIDRNNKDNIVKDQINNKNINIITKEKINDISEYKDILKKLGGVDLNNPNSIEIYQKDYKSKTKIKEILNKYNKNKLYSDKILYDDSFDNLLKSANDLINIVTILLIFLVAISNIVASIMILIITYISVLERTKEIGILRSLGASKKDITKIFNCETFIEGLLAGILGIIISKLLTYPISNIISNILNINIVIKLDNKYALILILISIITTNIAGFIPSKIASNKDPVKSLYNI